MNIINKIRSQINSNRNNAATTINNGHRSTNPMRATTSSSQRVTPYPLPQPREETSVEEQAAPQVVQLPATLDLPPPPPTIIIPPPVIVPPVIVPQLIIGQPPIDQTLNNLLVKFMKKNEVEKIGETSLITNEMRNDAVKMPFDLGVKIFSGRLLLNCPNVQYELMENRVNLYIGGPIEKMKKNQVHATSMSTSLFMPFSLTPKMIINQMSSLVQVYKNIAQKLGYDPNDTRVTFMSDIAASKRRIEFIVDRGHNGKSGILPFQRSNKMLTFQKLVDGTSKPNYDTEWCIPDCTTFVNVGKHPILFYIASPNVLVLNTGKSSNKSHTNTKLRDVEESTLGEFCSLVLNPGDFVIIHTGTWFSYGIPSNVTIDNYEWRTYLTVIETFFAPANVVRDKIFSKSHEQLMERNIPIIGSPNHYGSDPLINDIMSSSNIREQNWSTDKFDDLNDEWKSVLYK